MCGVPLLSSSSSKYPIAYVEIRVFSHATEDLKKVETAVRNTLPETLAEEAVLNKTNCVGHHGNPIVMVETKLSNRELLLSAMQKLGESLSALDKEQLAEELKSHIDKHNLFLRLDKQNAALGAVKLSPNDPIHFKIHFKNRTPDEITKICHQAGLLP
jgi:RNA binding exosome subunit